jgi:hypothetical protein
MLHGLVLAAQDNPQAAGLILRGIKGIFVAIGSIIAAIFCALVAGMKGRNPPPWRPCLLRAWGRGAQGSSAGWLAAYLGIGQERALPALSGLKSV